VAGISTPWHANTGGGLAEWQEQGAHVSGRQAAALQQPGTEQGGVEQGGREAGGTAPSREGGGRTVGGQGGGRTAEQGGWWPVCSSSPTREQGRHRARWSAREPGGAEQGAGRHDARLGGGQ
jgi:hypothetical protein